MGIFGTFKYSDGLPLGNPLVTQTNYGNQSKLAYSASPFIATALGNFQVGLTVRPKVLLEWTNPQGTIQGFRIVRNQDGFSENEEDGHIIFETFDPALPVVDSLFDQLFEVPLLQGKYAYYTIWVLLAGNTWLLSASNVVLIPKSHNVTSPEGIELISSEEKFVGLLPRAFTSKNNSILDEVDNTTDLFKFLGGFAYTLDEMLTYADLLVDSMSGKDVNPNFVAIMAEQFGLPQMPEVSLKTQKKLIRQAIYLYQHKGTAEGLGTFIESLTNYAPTITLSPNKLLSSQDSSFYKSTGNWVASSLGTLSAVTNYALSTAESLAVDKEYCGKFITTGTVQTLDLGNDTPIFKAIPVTEGISYQLSYYVTATTTGKTITPTVTWYDYTGTVIGSPASDTAASISTSWSRKTFTAVAPDEAVFMGLTFTFSAAATYYLDMIQVADSTDLRSSAYHPANGVEVYLAPTKINYLENPSFADVVDVDDNEWVIVGDSAINYADTTSVPGVLDGSHMLHVTTGTSTAFSLTGHTEPITTGNYYNFSVYMKTGSGTVIPTLTLTAYDSATNVPLVFNSANVTASNVLSTGVGESWQRVNVTLFVPTFSTGVYLKPSVTLPTAAAHELYFDAAQVEAGYSPTDYFDGNYVQRGAMWTGTVNDSVSIAYPNKINRIKLLHNNISSFLPMNTPYVITTGWGASTTIEILGFSS